MSILRCLSSRPLLALLAPLLVVAIALPCVPCGGSSPVTLPRPGLPSAPSGAPGGSAWGSESPQANEHDDASPNDPMGDATADPATGSATVDVSNNGGDLSGPNGVTQNGGGEGDCIEVQICWTYYTWVRRMLAYPTETGFEIVYYWAWVKKKVCNGGGDVEACPCTPCP